MRGSTAPAIMVGLLGLAVAGCAGRDVIGPEGALIAMVIVDEVAYMQAARLEPAIRPVGEAYAWVLRFVDCSQGVWRGQTHISDYCPLENGDSNFLPEGTTLYRIEGVDPAEALAVFREYDVVPARDPEWVELAPVVDAAGCTLTTTGTLCPPPPDGSS
jgi:hypothetical protein